MTSDPLPDPLPGPVRAAWESELGSGGRRPRRPELSLRRIVDAAVVLADRDGLAGISMAKVAAEIGCATMALYRHVPSKTDLLQHMFDAGLSAPPRDRTPPGTGWRDGLATWTRASLQVFVGRPWLLEIPITGPPLMPRNLDWMDWAMGLLEGTAFAPWEKLYTLLLLNGHARHEAALAVSIGTTPGEPADPEAGEQAAADYTSALVALADPGRFPALHDFVSTGSLFDLPPDVDPERADDFLRDFGLERILDGLQALLDSRGAPGPGDPVSPR
ncbi:TetR family transcriptional regulator [Nakamurella sp. YIM 132087]|uniref:TetR family transcriptional regulator n=1 Tax=Nakamurella alba TaxID=2665158 RepID=A0A7K1FNJ3_9ACTN|nr:TetR/AcrR family transcriptional regulator [Nakamurella alba]MTD15650.1 TetR family transcriptional regulator [Nakamurella alba]